MGGIERFVRILVDYLDSLPVFLQRGTAQTGDIPTLVFELPRVWLRKPHYAASQRRLAGSSLAHHGHEFRSPNIHRHPIEGLDEEPPLQEEPLLLHEGDLEVSDREQRLLFRALLFRFR